MLPSWKQANSKNIWWFSLNTSCLKPKPEMFKQDFLFLFATKFCFAKSWSSVLLGIIETCYVSIKWFTSVWVLITKWDGLYFMSNFIWREKMKFNGFFKKSICEKKQKEFSFLPFKAGEFLEINRWRRTLSLCTCFFSFSHFSQTLPRDMKREKQEKFVKDKKKLSFEI